MTFKADMGRISQKIGASLDEAGVAIKFELFRGVVEDTRVKTGRARGNWQLTQDAPAEGELDKLDPSGNATISDISQKIKGIGNTYLTNNLPYIKKLEELDGMVAKNVARLQRIIRNVR